MAEVNGLIVMENVCKAYPKSGGRGPVRVLDGVSFHIHPREYAAFVGPSGSGKSTLLNLMGCLDTPTSGRYRLDGTEVSSLSARELCALRREKIGFVFQGFQLLQKLSAWENVAFPLLLKGVEESRRREAALETLRKAWQTVPSIFPTSSAAASSSGSPSPGRCAARPGFFYATNRPPRWIRLPGMICWPCLRVCIRRGTPSFSSPMICPLRSGPSVVSG